MNLKKILSGFLAAAMAVTTMVTATFNAGAEGVTKQFKVTNEKVPTTELVDVAKAVITVKIVSKGSAEYMQAFTQSQTSAWTTGSVDISSTEEQTVTVSFTPAVTDNYSQVGIQAGASDGTDLSDVDVKIIKVEYQKADGTVVTTYDSNVPVISADNFTYSTYKNTSMEIGDTFTITFNSVVNGTGIPDGAKFDIKYKIPKIANPDPEKDDDYNYYAPVVNSEVNGTEGQEETGLKVTSETSGTKTIFTFEAVSAPTAEYAFMVNIETIVSGTRGYLWFTGDMGYKVVAATKHKVEVADTIVNGTVTAAPTTAAKDEKVTLTVTPAEGYELDTLTVATSTAGTDTVTVAADNTFVMPDADVTVTATFKKAEVALTGITLNKTTASVLVGGTTTLTATKVPATTTDETAISWASDTPAVATVSASGVVTGVKAGTATITAACGGFSAECEVTVTAEAKPCTAIALDKTTAEVTKGKTVKLTATTLPEDTTDDITWASGNTSVATVAADGTVTGVAEGTATITATCGTKSATCEITVTADTTPCTGITLDKTTAKVMKNATVTLTATATPTDTTDEITWASSDTSIATVDQTGKVTGVARGTADITVTCGTKTATCKISVNEEETISGTTPKVLQSAVTNGKYNENDVFVISAADVAAAKSVTVTVTDNTGKKTTKDVTECYKKVTYTAADGTTDTITANGNDCLLAVTVTGIPVGTTVTVTVTVNK